MKRKNLCLDFYSGKVTGVKPGTADSVSEHATPMPPPLPWLDHALVRLNLVRKYFYLFSEFFN